MPRPRAWLASLALTALGCAGVGPALTRPPDGAYRVAGLAADPMPFASEEGVLRYAVPLAGGHVEYVTDVAMHGGLVRVRTVVRNTGRAPVRYRLGALAVRAGAGEPLARSGLSEAPSVPPGPEERAGEAYRGGARTVAPGEKLSLERRFAPPASGDARSEERLTLTDEVEAGDLTAPLRLELRRAQ